ncbi:MAG: hypothetical protein Q8P58_00115 [Candidatus Adlerbacteria bacterium]|nr:hypothetical protein [Candidatus Adlerbacteria bacterium]MDZ4226153.1 hypothetical protein [Patescibacteria group bacterium]
MNREYWIKYYKEHPKQDPSDFVKFCLLRIPEGSHIVDLAAGDGRDTDLLCTRGICIPVEPHNDAIALNHLHEVEYADVVYARWFFHAVEEEVEDKVLLWCKAKGATLMTEMRAEEYADDKSHLRRVIEPEQFLQKLHRYEFIVEHFETARGFSQVGNDNPLLTRVIAKSSVKKKHSKKAL